MRELEGWLIMTHEVDFILDRVNVSRMGLFTSFRMKVKGAGK